MTWRRALALWPWLLFAALTLGALAPALAHAPLHGNRYDWRYFETMTEVARRAVVWYHQVPLWNPYSCGGEVGLANPQSLDAAPTFLLVLAFGTAVGLKLALCLYLLLAMDGSFRLSRWLGLTPTAAALAAVGYGLCGYLTLRLAAGHLSFLGVALYPYLLLWFDRSLGAPGGAGPRVEWVVPAALAAAWIALLGGTFTPPMAAELLVVWAAIRAVERRSLRPFLHLGLVAAAALTVAAVRMLPVLEFLRDHPRPAFRRVPDSSAPWQVIADLAAWREFAAVPGRRYFGHEYAAHLPLPVLLLAAASLVVALARGGDPARRGPARALWVLAAVAALLAMGNFSRAAPWSLLQRLPLLRDLRVPSRHLVLLALPLAVLGGVGLDAAVAWWRRRAPHHARLGAALAAALLLAAGVEGTIYGARAFRGVFTDSLAAPPGPVPFAQAAGSWRAMREVLFAGLGSLACDEEAPLQRADHLDPGDVPQVRLEDESAGELRGATFTPNRRTFSVDLRRPAVVLVNSNWNEHWHADRGRVVSRRGRLAVALAPGRHEVALTYAPRSFAIGAAVSGVSLPLLLGLFVWRRRRAG